MTTLPTRSFASVTQTIAAGIQGRAGRILTFAVGSTLRAIAEGVAALAMWLQVMILQVLKATRAATAEGADLDTFVADFGVTRLGPQYATGTVDYSRFTPGPSAPFIPVGATIKTADGSQTFAVYADAGNVAYSAALGGYTMAAETSTLTAPVRCITAGAGGNIQIGALTQSTTPITGIDAVSNAAAFTNGADQESDTALRARFQAYILGLSRGDAYGLDYAIASMAVNVEYTLTEGYNHDGSYHPGFFYVVADDGSGSPSEEFLDAVEDAVLSVRPLSIQSAVFAPAVVTANIGGQITTAAGFDHNIALAQVIAAVAANVNGLGLGNGLPYSLISAWAYAIPGVTQVSAVTLNSVSGDGASIAASKNATIKIGSNAWS